MKIFEQNVTTKENWGNVWQSSYTDFWNKNKKNFSSILASSNLLVSNSNEDPGWLVYLSYKKSCLVVTSDDKARRKYNWLIDILAWTVSYRRHSSGQPTRKPSNSMGPRHNFHWSFFKYITNVTP